MDRITGRMDGGAIFLHSVNGEDGVGAYTHKTRLPEALNKLAAYEDTGLTPEEVQALAAEENAKDNMLPCPECGDEGRISYDAEWGNGWYGTKCTNCDYELHEKFGSKLKAVAHWNALTQKGGAE